jgi:hypothetical protein
MTQPDAWRIIRRRAAAAGIAAPIGCHTFRAKRSTVRAPCVLELIRLGSLRASLACKRYPQHKQLEIDTGRYHA